MAVNRHIRLQSAKRACYLQCFGKFSWPGCHRQSPCFACSHNRFSLFNHGSNNPEEPQEYISSYPLRDHCLSDNDPRTQSKQAYPHPGIRLDGLASFCCSFDGLQKLRYYHPGFYLNFNVGCGGRTGAGHTSRTLLRLERYAGEQRVRFDRGIHNYGIEKNEAVGSRLDALFQRD